MMGRKFPTPVLHQMLETAQEAITFVDGCVESDVLADKRTQAAVSMHPIVIGEMANRFAPTPMWMRNRLAHGYREIDMSVVRDTVTNALPDLILTLSNTLRNAKTGTGLQTPSSTGDS